MKPDRLLIRGVNWLGDAVMTMPALQRLRAALPETHICLLTPEKLADLYYGHPAINEVLTFRAGESPFQIGRRLRKHNFDTALIFPNSPRSALESWFAGTSVRIGYEAPWRNWILTNRIPRRTNAFPMRKRSVSEIKNLVASNPTATRFQYPPGVHQVHDYLHLARELGADPAPLPPEIRIGADELAAVLTRFSLAQNPEPPLFGLNPAAEYGPAKCWPLERFAGAAAQLHKETNCQWLVFGTSAQAGVAEQARTQIRQMAGFQTAGPNGSDVCINLAGKTTLRELCVLLKACRLLLTNDSGPMHLASAVGTPVVVPFGSTAPELTGPDYDCGTLNRPAHLQSAAVLLGQAPCAPCFLRECPVDFRCMRSISVEEVVKAARFASEEKATKSGR